MKTTDYIIRNSLQGYLHSHFPENDDLIIDELGVCQGTARIDIAVINCAIHGFEIKSDSDNLQRLHSQIEIYNKVFDYLTLVTGKMFVDKALNVIPPWWGLMQVCQDKPGVKFEQIREPADNPTVDPSSVVQLLWKSEALSILTNKGIDKGYRSKPRALIWAKLLDSVPIVELKPIIRDIIKNRRGWKDF